ncbi:hypothetical protein RFI_15329 [Reticulomyxa filosa]|uniref:Uncharacterized protein n=1 Tax=Reticulomyxa filosa TaxID=46433 RepID=X6N7L8_RETFI|nr:hypothetical protein RFI_15329 [Reticulomyxa filosa]|eukprot:ETO21873.1 hypothetical protein RFI_15329 [Reticulomyxa filosa]
MKVLLVLVALHVLNVFAVMLNASEKNISNCSWTNKQKYFNQHININIVAISRNRLLNQMWKSEILRCEQCLQLYNNMASASSLQISNNELMQSTNKIIRTFQSTLSANTKQSKKSLPSKTSIMNNTQMYIYSSGIQVYNSDRKTKWKKKWSLKNKKEDINVYQEIGRVDDELNDFLKKNKNNSNCKMDVMISAELWNRSCNSLERVSIVKNGRELFWYNAATNTNITSSHCKFSFPKSCCAIQASVKHKFVQSPTRQQLSRNFESVIQCCNVKFFYFLFFLFKTNKRTNKKIDIAPLQCS